LRQAVEDLDQLCGFVDHLTPGAAVHLPTGKSEALVAPPVFFECRWGAMLSMAVGLHDPAVLSPEEVDGQLLIAEVDRDVDLGKRYAKPPAQSQEPTLQLLFRQLSPWIVLRNQQPQTSDATAAVAPPEEFIHFGQIEDAEHFRPGDRISHLPHGASAREVEKSPGNAGARDSGDSNAIPSVQCPIPVRGDPVG
jgi:hypothetical protein